MPISHIRNDSCWHACTWLAKKSRPEVGYWVTLEDYHKNVSDAEAGRDDYHSPDGEFLISIHAYLQEKKSNAGLYEGGGYDVRNLATKPPL
jgi:hypothetical protein